MPVRIVKSKNPLPPGLLEDGMDQFHFGLDLGEGFFQIGRLKIEQQIITAQILFHPGSVLATGVEQDLTCLMQRKMVFKEYKRSGILHNFQLEYVPVKFFGYLNIFDEYNRVNELEM
jgi:hypothetical protein